MQFTHFLMSLFVLALGANTVSAVYCTNYVVSIIPPLPFHFACSLWFYFLAHFYPSNPTMLTRSFRHARTAWDIARRVVRRSTAPTHTCVNFLPASFEDWTLVHDNERLKLLATSKYDDASADFILYTSSAPNMCVTAIVITDKEVLYDWRPEEDLRLREHLEKGVFVSYRAQRQTTSIFETCGADQWRCWCYQLFSMKSTFSLRNNGFDMGIFDQMIQCIAHPRHASFTIPSYLTCSVLPPTHPLLPIQSNPSRSNSPFPPQPTTTYQIQTTPPHHLSYFQFLSHFHILPTKPYLPRRNLI